MSSPRHPCHNLVHDSCAAGRRHPGGSLHPPHLRPARRRRGTRDRDPGDAAGRSRYDATRERPPRARLRRLLLPDRPCRVVDSARLGLPRPRPAQVRPLVAPHQTANYVADLSEYFAELDWAWARLGADGRPVVLSAHSTGGLTVPLWLRSRGHRPAAMVLNSPWFDLKGPWLLRTVGTQVVDQVGRRAPKRPIPRNVSGLYARSLHRDHDGEFDFSLDWKPLESWPVHAGWLRAIRRGHAELHRGLRLPTPTLVLSSTRSGNPTDMSDEVHTTDIVLDVEQIRRWAPAIGTHVTSIAIPDARHDVWLSREPARKQAFAELDTWVSAYVDTRSDQ
ncbi:alpha/beta hydrolase [Nocardioides alcanivorans]|uniref:alpha/beta hydrolase n=1 Tax=Nocardioides alcanivorans TaxID=2897352 RepID=UPI0028964D3A|nr:alpha/beta hydrolase [Nocardioides alcanivorans]